MRILSWNVRGLGMDRTVRRFRAVIRDISLSVIFLMESKLPAIKMERVRKLFGYVNGVEVSSDGRSGGLCLGWKDTVTLSVRSFSTNHIDVMIIEENGGRCWRLTGFYGAPEVGNRIHSWNLLRRLNDCPDVPWCVIGDFNELLFQHEKSGGSLRHDW
ncbi:hypothetical protein HRI_000115700 [Hibiscus trionum]|uniref:Endonuclease/exonuclease/phosphatase domain-containing protein n=1 Tax=Hibiscus trionum TaxID=183268 RepID=A0A9W7GRR0_HIBTR|nr:hypothetical protein HRI_000115700 [Hibiscus trionum]